MRHSTLATWRRSCLTPRATAWGHNGRPRPPQATGGTAAQWWGTAKDNQRATTNQKLIHLWFLLMKKTCKIVKWLPRPCWRYMIYSGFVSSSCWIYDNYGFWTFYTYYNLAENPRSQVKIVNFPSTCLCLTSPLSNFGFVFSGDTVDLRAEKKANVKTKKERLNPESVAIPQGIWKPRDML